MASVHLIALGYEWFCYNCRHTNTEIEITTTVLCATCRMQYQTDDEVIPSFENKEK